jgi:serine/threonine protein kinase
MKEGESLTIVDNKTPSHKENKVCLEDFKIKKVLDKGSFGKVFLVVNSLDGNEYAMKRINKDILIEKG